MPRSEHGLEEDHVPLPPKAVEGEVEDRDRGGVSQGAKEVVEEYVAR